jgi:hypothetical protein
MAESLLEFWLIFGSFFDTHISRVYRIVHNLDPAFESGYLKEAQIRFAHVIEIHWRVFPCVVFSLAHISKRNDFLT